MTVPPRLAAALVEASAELSDVVRTKVADTGTYTYRFAELADVLAIARPVLHRHGLAHTQLVETEPAGNGIDVVVRTQLVHVSGHVFTSPPLRLHVAGANPQQAGSAITYARRYSLMSTLGIAADDDDAASVSTPVNGSRPVPAPRPPTGRSPAEAQARELLTAAPAEVRTGIQKAFREHFGVSLSNLPSDRHAEALSFVIEQLAVPDETDR